MMRPLLIGGAVLALAVLGWALWPEEGTPASAAVDSGSGGEPSLADELEAQARASQSFDGGRAAVTGRVEVRMATRCQAPKSACFVAATTRSSV
jgi:hypothetical protein